MGVIDEAAIDRLFLVGELTKNISASVAQAADGADADAGGAAPQKPDERELSQFFPPFLWLLRDFSLKLKDNDGNDISLRTYLETALEDRQGTSRRVEEGNRIRQSFRTLFTQVRRGRCCHYASPRADLYRESL